jgi:radical SAM superfamily enzyme YgiQ (UPF0313 family)
MRKRILLINTPQENIVKAGIEDDFIDMIGYYPPLGLLYLGTILKQNGYDVKILDCVPQKINYIELDNIIKEFVPFVVGITTYTMSMVDVLKTINIVKKVNSEIITVLGGHHVNLYPLESIKYENVDFILTGEGEESFPKLIDYISENKSFDEILTINGVGFFRNDKEYLNHERAYVKEIDKLPFPDRTFLPFEIYKSIVGKNDMVATIMSSRGCPFKCTYCYTPNKSYRSRSTQNIIEEIKYLINLGFKEIFFFDDLFALKTEKVIEFAEALQIEKIKIDWSFRARINTVTPELVEEVKKAGIHRIQFGIESGVNKTLDRVKKGTDIERIKTAIKLCRKAKITTIGNFMMGLPDETENDIKTTLKFSRKIGLNYAQYSVLVPYPFTEIYEEGLKSGVFSHDYWQEFADNPIDNFKKFKVQYWTKEVSEEFLFKTIKKSFKLFYLRPITIMNKLREISTFQEFKFAVKGALSVLKFNPVKKKTL